MNSALVIAALVLIVIVACIVTMALLVAKDLYDEYRDIKKKGGKK